MTLFLCTPNSCFQHQVSFLQGPRPSNPLALRTGFLHTSASSWSLALSLSCGWDPLNTAVPCDWGQPCSWPPLQNSMRAWSVAPDLLSLRLGLYTCTLHPAWLPWPVLDQLLSNYRWCLAGLPGIICNWSKFAEASAPCSVGVAWGTQLFFFLYQSEHPITRKTNRPLKITSCTPKACISDFWMGWGRLKSNWFRSWMTSQEESIKSIFSLQKCIYFLYNFNAQSPQLWQR